MGLLKNRRATSPQLGLVRPFVRVVSEQVGDRLIDGIRHRFGRRDAGDELGWVVNVLSLRNQVGVRQILIGRPMNGSITYCRMPNCTLVSQFQIRYTTLTGSTNGRKNAERTRLCSVPVRRDTIRAMVSATAVPESQLAKEQAEIALAAARQKGAQLATAAVARFGAPTLAAGAALILGWFFLSTVSITTPLGGLQFTFWQLLGMLNSGAAGVMQQMGGGGTGAAAIMAGGGLVRRHWL